MIFVLNHNIFLLKQQSSMLPNQLEEILSLNCEKLLRNVERNSVRKNSFNKTGILHNWIQLNKEQFSEKGYLSARKTLSFDKNHQNSVQKVKIEFESPKKSKK